MTIQHEKPQLEVQKTELLRKEEELKVQLAELEDSLLEVRTTLKGAGITRVKAILALTKPAHSLKL